DGKRSRLVRSVERAIDDAEGYAEPSQLCRQCKTRRSGADDQAWYGLGRVHDSAQMLHGYNTAMDAMSLAGGTHTSEHANQPGICLATGSFVGPCQAPQDRHRIGSESQRLQ